MKMYRDFDNDPVTFPVSEGKQFLSDLHGSGRHWVPIVDAAIYVPNPDNATDW
jgi:alpha-glucosidase